MKTIDKEADFHKERLKREIEELETKLEESEVEKKMLLFENKKMKKDIVLSKKITIALVNEKFKLTGKYKALKNTKQRLEKKINRVFDEYEELKQHFEELDSFWSDYLRQHKTPQEKEIINENDFETKRYIENLQNQYSKCVSCEAKENDYNTEMKNLHNMLKLKSEEILYWKTKYEDNELKNINAMIKEDQVRDTFSHKNFARNKVFVGLDSSKKEDRFDLPEYSEMDIYGDESLNEYNEEREKTETDVFDREPMFESMNKDIDEIFGKLKEKVSN